MSKFMLLIYESPATIPSPGTPEHGAYWAAWQAASERVAADATIVSGAPTGDGGTVVRPSADGGPQTAEAPHAPSSDLLTGYFVIEAADEAAARTIAAYLPPVAGPSAGAVEVRQLAEMA